MDKSSKVYLLSLLLVLYASCNIRKIAVTLKNRAALSLSPENTPSSLALFSAGTETQQIGVVLGSAYQRTAILAGSTAVSILQRNTLSSTIF